MNLSIRDDTVEELLDVPGVDERQAEESFHDLRRMSDVLGWTRLAVQEVAQLVASYQFRAFSVLDVATGAAYIPAALARWARHQNLRASITACDISQQALAAARTTCTGFPEIQLEWQNALALTYPDQSFDVVLCQGILHHFPPRQAIMLMQELQRVARHAVILTDLQRTRPLYASVWIALHTIVRNPITRHDGLVSIRRAYRPDEVQVLAEHAGLYTPTLRTQMRFRQSLIWQRCWR